MKAYLSYGRRFGAIVLPGPYQRRSARSIRETAICVAVASACAPCSLFGHFAELTARGTEDIFVAIIGTGVRSREGRIALPPLLDASVKRKQNLETFENRCR